ncbi:SpvB/TcaC N-terminal domain-containing protein [Nonomuraea wenchangensis]|uniref:SpvB/TcaC N-terminal domain-containing protein n=1 Tax=Nonomuraea wenchangensis TaxID=568860 RepID=UPI00384F9800
MKALDRASILSTSAAEAHAGSPAPAAPPYPLEQAAPGWNDGLPRPPEAPAIALPKGGGAVRGIGEKFAVSPVTGTGSLSIPLPVSPGRSGFAPRLALSYDSGAAQGLFGMGWGLGLSAITRRTDPLPGYDDAAEGDVFVLAGAEDLVPEFTAAGVPLRRRRTVDGRSYEVTRYRPRIEGLYARIERWTDTASGETHWRSIGRGNVTTVYGRDAESRIADPDDPDRRIFSWLICESFDDRGNAMVYRYAAEGDDGVDLGAAHERNRPSQARTANRYIKSIRYGNRVSRLVPPGPVVGDGDVADDWLFELVFDYGEHDERMPTACERGERPCRHDPFSTYRAGFEVRTYRLCRRILMFHHFPREADVGRHCLVRSMRLAYREARGVPADRELGHPAGALLASVTVSGHRRSGTGYLSRDLPALELAYSTVSPATDIRDLDAESAQNLPVGVDGASWQWVDLDGESIPSVLAVKGEALYYKANRGGGRLGALEVVPTRPAFLGEGLGRLLDLAGDGRLDLVHLSGPAPGFAERTGHGGWMPHRPFRCLPQIGWNDPALRFCDVDGDGRAEALVTEVDAVTWYPSLGEDGFGSARRVPVPPDEDVGPRVTFADGTGTLHLADFSGDGLADIVRVRNGEVCYWPNLGHGRFGPKVVMDGAPVFDRSDRFDPARLRLADVDGSGPTDLLYLGPDGVDLYANLMGNSWAEPVRVTAPPPVDNIGAVDVVDLFGRGTACLVWSSPLPGGVPGFRYLDLAGTKPNLLVGVADNLGMETTVGYASSTEYYLRDKAAGRPWLTRLPFPVHVVERTETIDRIARTRTTTRYRYRDGYFDGHERQFRGFGMVEHDDIEHQMEPGGSEHLPPVRTRSWFHTGAYLGRDRLSQLFAEQYYPPPGTDAPAARAWLLDDTPLPPGLPVEAEREACRALKGRLLRQEVYALDGSELEQHPYTVVEHNYSLRPLQLLRGTHHGVFAADPRESITVTCERRPEHARVTHEMVLEVDPFGTVLHSVMAAYGRSTPDASLPERTRRAQATTLVTETLVRVTESVDRPRPDDAEPQEHDAYRTPVPYDTAVFHLTGRDTAGGLDLDGARPRLDRDLLVRTLAAEPGTPAPLPAGLARRLLGRSRVRFQADDLTAPVGWGELPPRGLVHETYRLALPDGLVAEVYGSRIGPDGLTAAGYVHDDGGWWAPSGTVRYAPAGIASPAGHAREHFFVPRRYVDPFAAVDPAGEYATEVDYDRYDLLPVRIVDPAGNTVTAGPRAAGGTALKPCVDYRVLAPTLVTDPNRNRTAVVYDALGMVAATAVMGKPEDDTGDRIDAVVPDETGEAASLYADPHGRAVTLLGEATTRLVYDVDAYRDSARAGREPLPCWIATIVRERHVADPAGGGPVQVSFGYGDGLGRPVQHKRPAEPPPGTDLAAPWWTGSGWTIYDEKGRPRRRFEPFPSPTHAFEFAAEHGVSPVLLYDPPGRPIGTLHPNGTYDKTVIGPWETYAWDANDTAALPDAAGMPTGNPADDPDIGGHTRGVAPDPARTWYRRHIGGEFGDHGRQAAQRTLPHTATPLATYLDPLGRPVLTVADNRTPIHGGGHRTTWHRTHTVLDVTGDPLEVADCTDGTPGPTTGQADRALTRHRYDLTGRPLLEESLDAAPRRVLPDIAGTAVAVWEVIDGAGTERLLTTRFDRLRRPVEVALHQGGAAKIVRRTVYGEDAPGADLDNLRGRVWRDHDGAGTLVHAYDVHGNPASTGRTLLAGDYREAADWTHDPPLETVTRTGHTAFDALNRPHTTTHPDGTTVRRT